MADKEGNSSTQENENSESGTLPEKEESTSKASIRSNQPRITVRGTKAPEIPLFERKNWLIHLHYVRKDFETCKLLIKELLEETNGLCEYAIYTQGLILRQAGDINGSLEHFQQCLKLNPSNPANIKQVGRTLFLLGKYRPALETYNQLESLGDKDWEALHHKGACYMQLKEHSKAKECLSKSLELSPQTVTYKDLGRLHLLNRDIKMAIETYRAAAKHNPEDAEILSTLGLLYLQIGESQKAFEYLGGALTFDPGNYKAILAAGSIMQCHGDYDVALSKYRTAAQVSPESPHLWNNIGMCFYGKQKYVAAISCLKRANYLAPFEWKIHYNLGLTHLAMHQYASSFHFLKAGQSLQPTNSSLLMLIGIALSQLNDQDNSIRAFKQATKDRETVNPLVYLNYAILLYNSNDKSEAKKNYEMFQSKWRLPKESPSDDSREANDASLKLGTLLQVGKELSKRKSKESRISRDEKRNES